MRASDEDLRDLVCPRELNKGTSRVLSFQNAGVNMQVSCKIEVLIQAVAFLGRE